MKRYILALLIAVGLSGAVYGDLVISAPSPDSLMLRVKTAGFDWTVDGPTIWQVIRLLDADTPDGPVFDRLQAIGDQLVDLAGRHRIAAYTWHQRPALLDWMLRGAVLLYYLHSEGE